MSPLYRDDSGSQMSEMSDDDFEHVKQTTLDDIVLSTPEPESPISESIESIESMSESCSLNESVVQLSPQPVDDPALEMVEFEDDEADPSLLGFLGELFETAVQMGTSARQSLRHSAKKSWSALSEALKVEPKSLRGGDDRVGRRRALLLTHFLHGYVAFVLVTCVAMVYMHIGRLAERRTCISPVEYGINAAFPKADDRSSHIRDAIEGLDSPVPNTKTVTPETSCLVSWKPLDGKSHSQKFVCGGVKYYMTLNANVKEEGKAPRLAAFLSTASDSVPSNVNFTLSFIGRKGSKAECAKRMCRHDGRLLWKNQFSSKLVPAGGVGTAPISRADALRDMRSGGTFYLEVSIDKVELI